MTGEDYETLARAFQFAIFKTLDTTEYKGIQTCIREVCVVLKQDNEHFDIGKFIRKCNKPLDK